MEMKNDFSMYPAGVLENRNTSHIHKYTYARKGLLHWSRARYNWSRTGSARQASALLLAPQPHMSSEKKESRVLLITIKKICLEIRIGLKCGGKNKQKQKTKMFYKSIPA